jgi:uncharacterized small protein (DUF1192 family)
MAQLMTGPSPAAPELPELRMNELPKEKKMSLLSVEISRERISALEAEIESLQWAAEARKARRETLHRVVSSTGRAARQEGRILLGRLFRRD